jgi:hypothetical protein
MWICKKKKKKKKKQEKIKRKETKISSKPIWMKFRSTHIKGCQVSKYLICTLNIKGH